MNLLQTIPLPPTAILTCIALAGAVIYADKKLRENPDGYLDTYSLPDRLRHIFSADDYAALRGVCKLRSALEDIICADYARSCEDMTLSHIRDVCCPVMPKYSAGMFANFADMYGRATSTVKNISEMDSRNKKSMAVISEIADTMHVDSLSNILRMKDTISTLGPLISAMMPPQQKSAPKDEIRENINYVISDDENTAEQRDTYENSYENDDGYDEILSLVKMMKG